MNTQLKSVYAILMVKDVSETINFYKKLGFTVYKKAPENAPVWTLIQRDDIT